jgi:hypothetical protein
LANKIKMGGKASLEIDLDLFNAFNSGVVLGAGRQANSGTLGVTGDMLAPRILRLGARLGF